MVNTLDELFILGAMSGTSLDGLDLAACSFRITNSVCEYKILNAKTIKYPDDLSFQLKNAMHLTSAGLCELDHRYGKWIGKVSREFVRDSNIEVDWISSHGHTVFHQPEKGYTLQIGNGHDIAAEAGIPVICDFRSKDVALGGQGAPLVPVGDEYLFREFDCCLNLGGFSNISFRKEGKRIAFDICPVNTVLNYLAEKSGLEFDNEGQLGSQGKIISGLLKMLNSIAYYSMEPPKSLGREWLLQYIFPLLDSANDTHDLLRTFYEHIAFQISKVINSNGNKNVLITGGGAKNSFLLSLLTEKTAGKIIKPDVSLIDFKEALIFAFLGYLRINNFNNVWASVTGSSSDHCSGTIYNF